MGYVLTSTGDRGGAAPASKVGLTLLLPPSSSPAPSSSMRRWPSRSTTAADLDGLPPGAAGSSGLGKKVLLSNQLAVWLTGLRPGDGLSASFAWLGARATPCRSTTISPATPTWPMALARCSASTSGELQLPLHLPVHHRISKWRWHISLSTWFRDYVYFPWGQPGGLQGQTHPKPVRSVAAHRHLGMANWTFPAWDCSTVPLVLEKYGHLGRGWPVGQMAVYLPDGELPGCFSPGGQLAAAGQYLQAMFGLGAGGGRADRPSTCGRTGRCWRRRCSLPARWPPACGTGPRKGQPLLDAATPCWRRRCSWCRRPS